MESEKEEHLLFVTNKNCLLSKFTFSQFRYQFNLSRARTRNLKKQNSQEKKNSSKQQRSSFFIGKRISKSLFMVSIISCLSLMLVITKFVEANNSTSVAGNERLRRQHRHQQGLVAKAGNLRQDFAVYRKSQQESEDLIGK